MKNTSPNSLISETEDLMEAVAADPPASQVNPKNKKHITSMEKVMQAYFKRLENAFPMGKVQALYRRHVEE